MVWATNVFSKDGWYGVRDLFEDQYDSAGEPKEMMLVFTDTPDFQTSLFVKLPDQRLLTSYVGFKIIDNEQLPQKAGLLFGDPSEFARQFRPIPRR